MSAKKKEDFMNEFINEDLIKSLTEEQLKKLNEFNFSSFSINLKVQNFNTKLIVIADLELDEEKVTAKRTLKTSYKTKAKAPIK